MREGGELEMLCPLFERQRTCFAFLLFDVEVGREKGRGNRSGWPGGCLPSISRPVRRRVPLPPTRPPPSFSLPSPLPTLLKMRVPANLLRSSLARTASPSFLRPSSALVASLSTSSKAPIALANTRASLLVTGTSDKSTVESKRLASSGNGEIQVSRSCDSSDRFFRANQICSDIPGVAGRVGRIERNGIYLQVGGAAAGGGGRGSGLRRGRRRRAATEELSSTNS